MIKNTKAPEITAAWDRLDSTIRPQDDFFNYVNKKWLAANPIPPSESRWGTFDALREQSWINLKTICDELLVKKDLKPGSVEAKIRDFYAAGLDFDKHQAQQRAIIIAFFDQIDNLKNTNELVIFFGQLQRYQIELPWSVTIEADEKNSLRHVFRLYQSGLTLPNRDYYLNKNAKNTEIRKAYKQHMTRVHKLLPEICPSPDKMWETVYKFESALAEHSLTNVELRDVEATYNLRSYTQIKADYINIDWDAYAANLGCKIKDNTVITAPDFIKFVDQQLDCKPLVEWQQYLKWQIAINLMPRVSETYAVAHFEFFGKALGGRKELMPLWKRIIIVMNDVLGEALGQLYTARFFPETSKQQVIDLIEDVRVTYASRIKRLDWMTEDTKIYALKKLANMKVLVGFPDKWRDYSNLDTSSPLYLANFLCGRLNESTFSLLKLHKPVSRDEWFMTPQTVNAYHDPSRLVICFPAAILQRPFFDPAATYAENIGGIGTVIAHEFTHGFDDQGSQFDAEGNVRNWRTDQEKQTFSVRSKIIIDSANNFEVEPGLNMNGELVIGEAIADLGGVEIAYEALRSKIQKNPELDRQSHGMSPGQLFFTTFASTECDAATPQHERQVTLTDPHPNCRFRVNGIVCNSQAFYDTYAVHESDKMYVKPEKRAAIW